MEEYWERQTEMSDYLKRNDAPVPEKKLAPVSAFLLNCHNNILSRNAAEVELCVASSKWV